MFRNYFITAFRNIIRNKIQSIIQISSLAIGITAFILIGLYARHELSCDKYNENYDRIYRLEYGDFVRQPSAPGHEVKQQISEVENVVRIAVGGPLDFRYISENDTTNERIIKISDYYYCDSTIFEVFTFNFIQGDPKSALRDPYTCVLTENTARTIFGDRDPVGESIDKYTVTGIIKDVKYSHFNINMLISIVSMENYGEQPNRGEPGYLNNYSTDMRYIAYLLLPESNNQSFVEKKVNDFFMDNMPHENFFYKEGNSFSLRPLKDIYFSTDGRNEGSYIRHGNLKLLKVLLTISVFVLLLAIINYINLTTARASLRAKEVRIRKVAGSSKGSLISQFLVEAILVTAFSFLVALTLVQVLLPVFIQLASTDLNQESILQPEAWVLYVISVIFLGLLSGIYPAVYMTGFKPVISLSGNIKGSRLVIFRRILLTFQFAISIVLIIGVFVIFRQLNYMRTANLGFNSEFVINLRVSREWARDFTTRQLFRQQLLQYPSIKGVAFSNRIMGTEGGKRNMPAGLNIGGVKKQISFIWIDPDFFDVMEIKLLEGRNFSRDRTADYAGDRGDQAVKVIFNETAVHEFELKQPVGTFAEWANGLQLEVIGVIRDINYISQHEKIEPFMYIWVEFMTSVSIKIAPTDIPASLRIIEEEFESVFPGKVFDYSFLDETYAQQYLRDEKTARIISIFAIVAVIIACLGLFGLSSFMAARRTKEIGIRKAMGASVKTVFLLLSREFIKWVVISIVIACPLAWFIMNKWLQSFAYRTNIGLGIFVLAILIAFAITFITVTWQSLKTARTNPIHSLRYE